ncbi:hypothetical protein WJ64_11365 [Burkholderia ubonensis]|nr:hypothetical protein WJ64_11365 [Burkholderia ubonensis]
MLTLQDTGWALLGNIQVDSGSVTFNQQTAQTLSNVITGSGSIIQHGTGTLTLTGSNAYSGGTTISAGTLRVSANYNLGAANGSLTFDGGTLNTTDSFTSVRATTLNAGGGRFSTDVGTVLTMSGVIGGSGNLAKTDDGTLTLTGSNSYTGGTSILGGTLQLGDGGSAGGIMGDVANHGTLAFNRSDRVVFNGVVSGTGQLQQIGAGTTVLTGDHSYTGGTTISGGTLQLGNGGSTGSIMGDVRVEAGGALAVERDGAFTLGNALSGSGLVTTRTNGQAFDFGAGTGAAFTGTLAVGNSQFDLSGVNTVALTNATLRADTGSVITVGDGSQSIGGLTFNGGTMVFNATLPDQTVATTTIATGALDASGLGTVQITIPDPYVPSAPGIPDTANLFEQDDANILVKLVDAQQTRGSGGALELRDQNGNMVSDAQAVDIAQGGNTVAVGTYDYRLSTAPGDGLYVNYGLTQLDLQDGQTLTLAQAPGATGAAADLSARLTGSGGVAIEAGTDTVSLSNARSDYTGETTVASGRLRLEADNALGQTSLLRMTGATATDLNGRTQTIGALEGRAGSLLDIHGGTLHIVNGGTSQGTLTGAGQLHVQGGVLDVRGANATLLANVAIDSGATVRLDDAGGLGRGHLVNEGTLALDGATGILVNALSGAGAVNLSNGAEVAAIGDNSGFSGQFTTGAGTMLTVVEAANLGTAGVANDGTLKVNTATDWTLANTVSGSGDFVKQGTGTLTLTGSNSYTGGTSILGGTLQLGDGGSAGGIMGDVANHGTLAFNRSDRVVFNGVVSGTGQLQQIGAGTTVLTGDHSYTGGTTISGGTLQLGNGGSTGSIMGDVRVEAGGALAVERDGAFTLGNALSGSGLVTTRTNGQAFDFGAGTGAAFTGTLAVGNSQFDLSGVNTVALTNATLRADTGSVITVGDGSQSIGGLTFNGGTMVFNATLPDQTVATSTITTGALDVNGPGTVQITIPDPYVPSAPGTPDAANLFEQEEGSTIVKLVDAQQTRGSGGALELRDQNGNMVSDAQAVDIAQGGNTVAVGTYDYRLSTAPGDGLYVNYGLTQLDLQDGQTLTLAQAPGATGAAADLSARLTGSGGVAIEAGTDTVSLSNARSDYTGETTVASGRLRLEADNALGQTSLLRMTGATATDLNGRTQTIGALEGRAGSLLDIHGGTLHIVNGGTSQGTLTGAGQLHVQGGVLDVRGANATLLANVAIDSGATVRLDDAGGLGRGHLVNEGTLALDGATGILVNALSGAGAVNLSNGAEVAAIGDNSGFSGQFTTGAGTMLTVVEAANLGTAGVANDGTLKVNTATDWTLANTVSGSGDFVKQGAGTLTVGDVLTHTGRTEVEAGTLIVGNAQTPDVALGGAGAGEVAVAQGGTLAGLGTVTGRVVTAGTVSALNALPEHRADPAGTFTLAGGLLNSGTVNLAGSSTGNALVVRGDYVGEDGTIVLSTAHGDDNSATDRLVIDGGHASGTTGVVFKRAGGDGAQTEVGIQVVQTVNGGTTDVGAFALHEASDGYRRGFATVSTGGYDYMLKRSGNGGNEHDWYLVSLPSPSEIALEAPEPDAYQGNAQAAMMMSVHTLRQRQGQAPGTTVSGAADGIDGAAWVRVVGQTSSLTGDRRDVSANERIFHAGGDVLRFSDGRKGSVRVGLMGMYASNTNWSTRQLWNPLLGSYAPATARGSVSGYNGGLYATWYGDRDILSGPYVDAWLMYGTYSNSVGGSLATDSYRSQTVTGSLETGYSFKVYDGRDARVYVEPQAQLVYSHYRAGAHGAPAGLIGTQINNGVLTRLGARLHGSTSRSTGREMSPFAEMNWWHGPATPSVSVDGNVFSQGLPRNRMEVKTGMHGQATKNLSVSAAVGVQTDVGDYAAVQGQLNLKYSWQ